MSKYYGNPKYIKQLESYYSRKNSIVDAHEKYKKLSVGDKGIIAQQFLPPAYCCPPINIIGIDVVWETWSDYNWDIDEHVWGSDFVIT